MVNREVKLYEIPKILETARVLDYSVLGAYNDFVVAKYSNAVARQNLSRFGSANGELTGSNIPMLIALRESGLLGGEKLGEYQVNPITGEKRTLGGTTPERNPTIEELAKLEGLSGNTLFA
jgi:hypothetical protein